MSDRSVRAGDLSQSVVVTGDGNTVSLVFGDAGVVLPLRRPQIARPKRRGGIVAEGAARELEILQPTSDALPFVGRKDALAALQAWLDAETDISVHAITAQAGTGKTRLAIQCCGRLDSDHEAKSIWIAGFLSAEDLPEIVRASATRSFTWSRNMLLVIDDAARQHQALGRWLDRLASQPALWVKLRILLLERQAPQDFGWWRDLTAPVLEEEAGRTALFHAARPLELPNLASVEERRRLMAGALAAARDLRPQAPARANIPAAGENAAFDRRLAETQFGNPLAVAMAGVIALERGPEGGLALRRLSAARHFGRRELERFGRMAAARGGDAEAMRHLVAFNGLAGGLPMQHLRRIVAAELAASARANTAEVTRGLLEQELPPVAGATDDTPPHLRTIKPDLIGEAAVIEHFSGEPSRLAEAPSAAGRAYGITGGRAATALFSLVQDFGFAAEDPQATKEEQDTGKRVLGWVQALAEELTESMDLLPLIAALPLDTLVLREPAAKLAERLVILFTDPPDGAAGEQHSVSTAWAWSVLGLRLSDLGRREEALAAAEEAVRLYSALAEARPDAFTPDLAMSLHNVAIRLSDLGRREEALAAAEEAVRLYSALAEARPDAFTPDLAMSLHNVAIRLSDLGRREEALAAAEEAVRLYSALAEARPDAFTPDLATSVNNVAIRLSDLGRREEALAAAEEAVRLYSALAEARPDAFTPNLAVLLNNLANRLSDLGRREEALAAAEEALRLRRALAETRPDAFTPDLATSVNNVAIRLSDLGRREEALAAAEEAVRLYSALAEARPDAFTPNLARSLSNLASHLSDLGRREEALAAAEEAVRLYRALAEARPDAFTPDLARSLSNLASHLSDLGRREEALAAAEEAVRLRRALAEARPDAFTPDLARSLNNLANRLGGLGRREEALAAAEEAVRFYRALAETRPDAFTPDLAMSLSNLANGLSDLGRREEALAAAEEALRLYRALADARPDAFTPDLAMSLSNLANRLSDLGRREEALAAADEAVRLRRALAETRPDAFNPDLAMSLNNLANRLSGVGRREEALAAAEEALRLRRALAETRPDAFTPDLAMSLNNLANRLGGLGRREEALAAAEEAVRLRRALAEARPDAFTPDLARSLWVLGDLREANAGVGELHEGVTVLTPHFLKLPRSFAGVMAGLRQSYIAACETLGQEPDNALLAPIAVALEAMNAEGRTR